MRILLKILAGILVLLAVLLTFVLAPPHLQIGAIEPPLPTPAELRELLGEADGPTGVHYLNVATQGSADGVFGHNVILLRWADGRSFMIDAGMDEAASTKFAKLLAQIGGGGEHTFVGDVAALLGDQIGSVAGVGFTHLHIDHTQGVLPFCRVRGEGARVYQTSLQAEEHNLHTKEGAELVADSCLAKGELSDGVVKKADAFPGLGLVALGGHTPGSTLFAAAVGGHLWLFSGDITNSKEEIVEDLGKGVIYSYLIVPENTARTAALRSWLRELDGEPDITVMASHDIEDLRSSSLPSW